MILLEVVPERSIGDGRLRVQRSSILLSHQVIILSSKDDIVLVHFLLVLPSPDSQEHNRNSTNKDGATYTAHDTPDDLLALGAESG